MEEKHKARAHTRPNKTLVHHRKGHSRCSGSWGLASQIQTCVKSEKMITRALLLLLLLLYVTAK